MASMLNALIRHIYSRGQETRPGASINQCLETCQDIFSKLKDNLFHLELHFTKKETQNTGILLRLPEQEGVLH